jgi:hypothetical protein
MTGLSSFIRKFPIYYENCWWEQANESNFDVDILQTRLETLRHHNPYTQRGNFQWEGTKYRSRVIWVTDENGRWINSDVLSPEQSNKRIQNIHGGYDPTNTHQYIAGNDPMGASKVKDKKPSDGGGAVFKRHNAYKDKHPDEGGAYSNWNSYNFVCTYQYRPDTIEDYNDDMLMMCIYYGCQLCSENLINNTVEHFQRLGFNGYLFYKVNRLTNDWDETSGVNPNTKNKIEGFNILKTYVKHHGSREKHLELLEWLIRIRGIDELTDYDGLAACLWAIWGDKYSNTDEDTQEVMEANDASDFLSLY